MSGDARFDPWTASIQEAVAATYAEPGYAHKLFQYTVAQEVKEAQVKCEQFGGLTGSEVLDLLASCVRAELVVPSWLAYQFLARHNQVREMRVRTWDEAFGNPFPTGKHIESERRAHEEMRKLANIVMDFVLRNPSKPHSPMWAEWAQACRPAKNKKPAMDDKTAQKLYKRAVELRIAQPIDRLKRAVRAAAESRKNLR